MTTAEIEPLAVGVKDAGKLVGLSHFTILQKVRAGEINAIRVGRRILVPVTELHDFLKRCGSSSATRRAK